MYAYSPSMTGRKRVRFTDQDEYLERPSKRLVFEGSFGTSFHPFFSALTDVLSSNTLQSSGAKKFRGFPGLAPVPQQLPQYPDRYRPPYARRPARYYPRNSTNAPSLAFLSMKLANVLDAEGIPIHLLGYRDNPRNLPPYLHTILCMQEDYINSKVNSDDGYFRMLETSQGRREMTKQARFHIKATLETRLSIGRSKRFARNHDSRVFNFASVKEESPGPYSFNAAKGILRNLPCSPFHVLNKNLEIDMTGLETKFGGFQCS